MSQTIEISTTQNVNIEFEPAGIGSRIVAAILDYIIIFATIGVISAILAAFEANVFVSVSLMLFFLFYDLLFEVLMSGATPGKLAMGIKVIKLDGSKPDLSSYLIRWIFRLLDGIGFIGAVAVYSILISDKSQRLGDILAGTTVIRVNKSAKLRDTILVDKRKNYTIVFPQVSLLTSKDIEIIKATKMLAIRESNAEILKLCAERVKKVLNITTDIPNLKFIKTIIVDFNHLEEYGQAAPVKPATTASPIANDISDFMPKYSTDSYTLENTADKLEPFNYDEFKPKIDNSEWSGDKTDPS